MAHYTIHGGLGSPYSMKMRAIFRYRRLPHVWKQVDMADRSMFAKVKAPVIPIIEFPDGSWHNDSTPMIFMLEKLHGARSIVPEDAGQAFLAYLLEDMADEWGTKAMFHYRWYRERDQKQMSEWLSFDRLHGQGRDAILQSAAMFRARQVGRMALVGCTPENAPVIEESARQIMSLFETHVTEESYLFGSRPSLADFGWMGQLSQLAVDPTPDDVMREIAPFTFRWLMNLDDASGVEGSWRDPSAPASPAIRGLLEMAGDVYFPFLLANAAAFEKGEKTFSVTLLGRPYSQGSFRYQQRCLWDLREAYARLDATAKAKVDPLLSDTGCLAPLKG
ncbi:MAG TPA: glutathione S-transferase N-terminal domain-containing protein [Rhizomicrobium sp.]|nr:glutathione S-transferase N-terminal domain-containing protein [Rhizomicrobium sp.]